jgi:hypothetical protein
LLAQIQDGLHDRFAIEYIPMGGMFTVLKIPEGITSYDDPSWYEHPAGTVAGVASRDQLLRDGIDVDLSPIKPKQPEHHHST